MHRKVVLFAALLAFVAVSAFAGGEKEAASAQQAAASGPVEIEFWTSQTQSDRVYFLSHFIPPPFRLR